MLLIGAGVAITGAFTHTCEQELFMIASAIIAGEFGLARGSQTDRRLTVEHVNSSPTASTSATSEG